MDFHYMTYKATLQHKNPCPGGLEIYNFVRHCHFLGHYYYTLSSYEPSPGEEKIFKEIHQFYTFYPKITSPLGGGHEIYNFMSPYHTDATYLVWLRLVGRS